jgi:hypothetical protein
MVPVTIDRGQRTLTFDPGEISFDAWKAYVEKINKQMEIFGEEPWEKPKPVLSLSAEFILENHKGLNEMTRGKLKKAPWWLRWLFDAIVTKEAFHWQSGN